MEKKAPLPSAPAKKADSPYTFAKAYTFRIRLHIGGPFAGQSLWELAMLDEKGRVTKIVADADKLDNCLDNLTGEFQADGYL